MSIASELLHFKVQFPRLYRKFLMTQYHQLFDSLWSRPSAKFTHSHKHKYECAWCNAHVFRLKLKPANDFIIMESIRGDIKFLHDQTTGSVILLSVSPYLVKVIRQICGVDITNLLRLL